MHSETLAKHNIKVKKEYCALPLVMVEKTKLIHVLINIISNAKDALINQPIDDRHVSLTINKVDQWAVISIRDSGSGISKDVIKTIFSHGFTTKSSGHGFGLHSSANYMTEMGGKLWAESEGPGKGATFFIRLPLEEMTS